MLTLQVVHPIQINRISDFVEKIQLEILGLSTSPSSGGAYALILNEHEGNRRLPIIIGTFEAQAIALELEHIKPPRPMTHDLLRNVIQSFNSFVKYIYINELKEGTFFAQIIYENNGTQIELDARPSDAIAVAIRFNAPIFVSPEVLNEAGIYSDEQMEREKVSTQKEGQPKPSRSGGIETMEDKIEALQKRLDQAIAEENYEKAAKLRDELNKLRG